MERFISGGSSDLPEWAIEVNAQKVLWQSFGIPWEGASMEDVMRALWLESAANQRRSGGV